MKKALVLSILLGLSIFTFAQTKEISRNWTSFEQSTDASFVKKKTKFKLTASIKSQLTDSAAAAGIWASVINKNGEAGSFDNTLWDRPAKKNEWQTFVVEGTMDENTDKLQFGGVCQYDGEFYFDDFHLYVEDITGAMKEVRFRNSGFESPVVNGIIDHWKGAGGDKETVNVKEFTIETSDDHTEGAHSLLITGKGTERDSTYILSPRTGYTPLVGAMVSMLNNLSARVEEAVKELSQKEADHFLDDKANSIGALVMHLAAAEAYYQVFTFEKRGFNEEEKKKWQVALDLGPEARKTYQGHDIEYYLNIYREVRKKTLEELAKRDDNWLAEAPLGSDINNHFCWFHVMEHQSSHLGQISLLKKRLPKEESPVKVDTQH